MKKFVVILLCISFILCSNLLAMNSSEIIEYEGKTVEIGLLLPIEVNPDQYVLTLSNVEILRVFIHPDFIIPTEYIAVKYNSKPFILPCKYIVYIKESK